MTDPVTRTRAGNAGTPPVPPLDQTASESLRLPTADELGATLARTGLAKMTLKGVLEHVRQKVAAFEDSDHAVSLVEVLEHLQLTYINTRYDFLIQAQTHLPLQWVLNPVMTQGPGPSAFSRGS